MTKEKAIKLLRTAKNVQEWNSLRESIKSQCTTGEQWLKLAADIDGYGLIVEVLGPDPLKYEEVVRGEEVV